MRLHAPTSVGDVLDRITILAHKSTRVAGSAERHVREELAAVRAAWGEAGLGEAPDAPEYAPLDRVNRELWAVEDRLREREANGDFGANFVTDARAVYRLNDQRAALKRTVTLRLGSALVEEKVHPGTPHG